MGPPGWDFLVDKMLIRNDNRKRSFRFEIIFLNMCYRESMNH